MNDDPIAKALNLTPLDAIEPRRMEVVPVETDTTVQVDFEYARGNMLAAIEKGQEALSGVLEIAGQSQHPRAFEVAATLVKVIADANKDLLELQKKKKELTGETAGPTTVNNNLFVGSTAELQQLIKKQNEQAK